MRILDQAQIGSSVKVNLKESKDRLNKEIIEDINTSSIATISDFRITDGQGIGVIVKLSNGKKQWFFENEINLLDKNGNEIEKDIEIIENNNMGNEIFNYFKYENKNKISDLINPVNFFIWLIVSFRDVY
tara:strand:- start:13 stop:402 length:390 start_codon:yes stop_codon:yes gene_type:complete